MVIYDDVTEQKRNERMQTFLAGAGKLLSSSSLDYHKTLAALAELAVPDLADWAAVEMVGEGGATAQLAVAHIDPAKVALARELRDRYPPDPMVPRGVHQVIRTGLSELYEEIPDEMLVLGTRDEEHLRISRALGLASVVIVPIPTSAGIVGAITLVTAESGRRYSATDLEMAEELGRRAGLAVENAMLYQTARDERDRVEEANRSKDQFLAMISHELRTPLSSMLGWTQLLRADENLRPEKLRQGLETIERNARTQTLIEDLLDVSRIISGKMRLDVRQVDPASVVEAALESVKPAADAKGIRLLPILDPKAGPVSGDPERLQQVVWNLLNNAIKFTPRGGRVQVELVRIHSHLELMVTDNGDGMSQDFLPHVFERFRQADQRTTRAHMGLGLGLAIVRHLVELHGGTVRVHSDGRGLGSMFVVRLPIAPVRLQDGPTPYDPVARRTFDRFEYPSELEGLHVLVVDDDADTRALLKTFLEVGGIRVTTASSAAEGFRLLQETRPDLLLSDIGMPGEDGYALIGKVRDLSREAGGRTPAVALTAYARTEDRTAALRAGFQMHVTKPIEPAELAVVLSSVWRSRRG